MFNKLNDIWSENRFLNACINVLIFLVGINFFHYGQLFLPVICFLLFIDNKLIFKVNDPKVFIVLCLFAVSFYAFSPKSFYSVMGFTCPMAYYIGSNMKKANEENVKKVICLFAISMCSHVILNSIFEYIVHGRRGFFYSTTHYDFWTREKISNTATAINADIMIGCLYYLMFHEKNKKLRVLCFTMILLSMFYLSVIGRRTPVMMLGIAFVLSFVYEFFVLHNKSEKIRKTFLIICGCVFSAVFLLILFYSMNIFNCQETLKGLHLIRKFSDGLINDQRFKLYFGAIKLMPYYLFGGQKISSVLGEQVHEFWIDIYDYAGVISYILMLVYSAFFIRSIARLYLSKKTENDFKILLVGVLSCIIIQMFLEPVMTGASLFLLTAIIIHALLERLVL